MPSKYLYDALGSKLFEAICELPEYGLTRADERLLRCYAHEIAERVPEDVVVCELGSGNGSKTRWILEAVARRRKIRYFPIEISRARSRSAGVNSRISNRWRLSVWSASIWTG